MSSIHIMTKYLQINVKFGGFTLVYAHVYVCERVVCVSLCMCMYMFALVSLCMHTCIIFQTPPVP